MGHAGPKTNQHSNSDWPQKHGDEDSDRKPSLIPRYGGSRIGESFQSAQRGQPSLESVKRIARFSGILLHLAGDLVKECLEFPRTWWQAIGFVALRGFGGSHNGPPQPTPKPAELEGLVETGTWQEWQGMLLDSAFASFIYRSPFLVDL